MVKAHICIAICHGNVVDKSTIERLIIMILNGGKSNMRASDRQKYEIESENEGRIPRA